MAGCSLIFTDSSLQVSSTSTVAHNTLGVGATYDADILQRSAANINCCRVFLDTQVMKEG